VNKLAAAVAQAALAGLIAMNWSAIPDHQQLATQMRLQRRMLMIQKQRALHPRQTDWAGQGEHSTTQGNGSHDSRPVMRLEDR